MGIAVIPAPGGGVTQKVDVFTSTGTWTAPSNCSSVDVFMVGGGGGGGAWRHSGNAGGAGGGGGGTVVVSRKLAVTPGTSYTVTIGAGGAGSVDSQVGALGNDSSFGSLLTVLGGGGGGTRNSSGTSVQPSAKGTTGGNAINNTVGGGGAGAANFYQPNFNSTPPFPAPANGQVYTSINNRIQGGLASNVNSMGGFGIEGFGGGGQPGAGGFIGGSGAWNKLSIHGGGVGGVFNENGGNATANTGGGGGGASCDNGSQFNGGNGGSGYAVITYWS